MNTTTSPGRRSVPMDVGMDARSQIPLSEHVQRRLTGAKAVGATLLIAVWGWFALVKNDQTPIFVYLNIAVHETGHVLFRPFGELVMLVMGSGFEVLFPLVAGLVFLIRKRDVIATAVCLGWAASALASAATYIADADDGRLALLGAAGPDAAGDWERILGPEHFDKLFLADSIAANVRTVGFLLWFVALGLAIAVLVRTSLPGRPRPARVSARPITPAAHRVEVDDEQMWR